MFKRLTFSPLILLLAAAGCSADPLGVLSVHVTLQPVLVELPDALSELDGSVFAAGLGTIHTDVPTGTGSVDVSELPELPDGFVYVSMLTFASHERAGLPAVGRGPGPVTPDEGGGSVIGAAMSPVGHDGYIGLFSTADIGDFELGALRSGMVMITGSDGAISEELDFVPVLRGTVDFTGEGTVLAPSEEEAGHSHGV